MGARALVLAASLGAALGLLLGAAAGLRLASDDRPLAATGNPPAGSGDARVAELEAEVARWRDAYQKLASTQSPDAGAEAAPKAIPPPAAAPPGAQPQPGKGFDERALVARGYTEEEARRLRERFDAYQLDELYLDNRAQREGWRQDPRFLQESRHLAEVLQAELGDRDFDALLYGAGRNNRVKVVGVLPQSVAARSGLEDGDEVVSYDGQRIFEARALMHATTEGTADQQTEMIVRRDGQEQRIVVPRGPIGIRLQAARVPPEAYR
ncbi:MAG TPA: PDZ domain-containing protein [Myxococcota bacterium]|nr:PDZ domain-containing protein [Myxococcota bacterium]